MNAQLFNFHAAGALLARPWIHQDHQRPAHLGSLAYHGTRESAQPLMHFATIITDCSTCGGAIVLCLALQDQTASLRALPGTDLGPLWLVPLVLKSTAPVTVGLRGITLTRTL